MLTGGQCSGPGFRSGGLPNLIDVAAEPNLACSALFMSSDRSGRGRNTFQMSRIVERLRAAGEEVPDSDLAHISPLMFGHIIPNGTYWFDRDLPLTGIP